MARKIESLNDLYIEKIRLERQVEEIEIKLSENFKTITDSFSPILNVVGVFRNPAISTAVSGLAPLIPLIASKFVKSKGNIWGVAAVTAIEYALAKTDMKKLSESIGEKVMNFFSRKR